MEAQRWGSITGEGLGFVLSKQASARDLFARGDKVGVIAFAIRAPCMGLDVPWLFANSNIGYEADTEGTLKIEDAWEETFRDTVERMCGRQAPLGITYPNEQQPDPSVPHEDDTQNVADGS
ncbi:hypothetical protein PsYK624_014280 [Phanerochaete sordida]|uniref:Uncharacterized protein n=1 Tax=Phanerochaete sordida TaxID=48140 RepID=A0A9P3FZV4_9APHY|nr:hypothetical protein PsYK624_014280 [Phanerochaete sordida]